jgi:hypothetical protein
MQFFCNSCDHRKVPASIKTKFNIHVKKMFIECPISSEYICGCTIKFITIDWGAFSKWLKDNQILEDSEEKVLKVIGLYEDA